MISTPTKKNWVIKYFIFFKIQHTFNDKLKTFSIIFIPTKQVSFLNAEH